jgi:uncharacterized membrane protein YciS (DUF1049 family)
MFRKLLLVVVMILTVPMLSLVVGAQDDETLVPVTSSLSRWRN